jgi:Fe-S-cluster containining protein
VIHDLIQIRRLGEQKRPENERFRKHLKIHGFQELKFRRIAEEIEEQIDCLEWANCCRNASVQVLDRDITKLAKYLRIKDAQFRKDYTQTGEEGLDLKRNEDGSCVFLSGNECTVYDARPAICGDFPHLVRGKGTIPFRMWQFIDRACYCPIVYNGLEAWKEEAGFRK